MTAIFSAYQHKESWFKSELFSSYLPSDYQQKAAISITESTFIIEFKISSSRYFFYDRSSAIGAISSLNTSEDEQRSSPWELIATILPLLLDSWHEATSGKIVCH